jgi:hypothetical protein
MRLLTINLNIIKQFIKTEKSGMSNWCDLRAGKSGTTF